MATQGSTAYLSHRGEQNSGPAGYQQGQPVGERCLLPVKLTFSQSKTDISQSKKVRYTLQTCDASLSQGGETMHGGGSLSLAAHTHTGSCSTLAQIRILSATTSSAHACTTSVRAGDGCSSLSARAAFGLCRSHQRVLMAPSGAGTFPCRLRTV